MKLEPSFGTIIKNGYFISQPSEREAKNYSPIFTGPDFSLRANDTHSQMETEEQANLGKVSDDHIKELTRQTPQVPREYNELKHTVKNFSDLTSLIFDLDSIFSKAIKDVSDHVHNYERQYTQAFIDKWYFGASFIHKLHVRAQMFMRSCAKGNPTEVNIMTLNFGETLDKIYMGEFVANLPKWAEPPQKRGLDNNNNSNGGGGNSNKRHNPGNQNQPNLPSHHLRDWEKGMRLQPNEKFYRIFHNKNQEGMNPPKTRNGTLMCTKFYGTGVCYGNCSKAHTQLDQNEKNTWKQFITHCRGNYSKWIESIKGNKKAHPPVIISKQL